MRSTLGSTSPTNPVRVAILGASGTGKTTLAEALAAHLAIPHFDSDAYYHRPTDPPYREPRPPEERRTLLERDLAPHPSWTLSGGALAWTPQPALDLTLLVFLDLPMELRLERLLARERARFGARLLPGGDMADAHREFMTWTRGYDDGSAEGTNTRPIHESLLRDATCRVLRLVGPMSRDERLERVLNELG
jgi:adenylate kinase family enzyme